MRRHKKEIKNSRNYKSYTSKGEFLLLKIIELLGDFLVFKIIELFTFQMLKVFSNSAFIN